MERQKRVKGKRVVGEGSVGGERRGGARLRRGGVWGRFREPGMRIEARKGGMGEGGWMWMDGVSGWGSSSSCSRQCIVRVRARTFPRS